MYAICLSLCWVLAFPFIKHGGINKFTPHSIRMAVSERTRAIFDSIETDKQTGGAGGSSSLEGLERLDAAWDGLKNGGWSKPPAKLVEEHQRQDFSLPVEYDVAVCGGTLGIFFAFALQQRGFRTVVVERGKIAGRPQEWNISRKELEELVELGILRYEDIDAITSSEFNPVRVGFKTDTRPGSTESGFEAYTKDVLNLGIRPDKLINIVLGRYKEIGGTILEETPLVKVDLYNNAAVLSGPGNPTPISTRLVLDAMGGGSPIARQARGAVEPDGICIVVGSCARGFMAENNTYSDLIYTDSPITKMASGSELQYFWEAFPAGSGPQDRTTYLFAYMDAKKERPSVNDMLDDYWDLLPRYQGKSVEDLQFLRILYGMFPTYRDSPLQTKFDRILQVGDASGIQSPLSFGGFGSLTRHLERVTGGIHDALRESLNQNSHPCDDLLQRRFLAQLNPYQPNLSACWMFQRAMSVPIGKKPQPGLVVGTLSNSFSAMEKLGDPVMKPFLQDVLQPGPLARTLLLAAGQDLLTPFKIVPHVGVTAITDFLYHFFLMFVYSFLAKTATPVIDSCAHLFSDETQFELKCKTNAWKFGSGLDY